MSPTNDQNRKCVKRRGERGFTVLETVIAMIMMMTVGLGASALFLYAITNNAAATARAQSLAVAQQELERLRSVDFNDPLLNTVAGTPTTVTRGPATFRITKTVNTVAAYNVPAPTGGTRPTLKIITITVAPVINNAPWAAGGVAITTTRATFQSGPY